MKVKCSNINLKVMDHSAQGSNLLEHCMFVGHGSLILFYEVVRFFFCALRSF